jgi:membrane-associated phospholipid phosphatase
MTLRRKLEIWSVIGAGTLVLVLASFHWVDRPVAILFRDNIYHFDLLSRGLASTVLVTIELLLIAFFAGLRMAQDRLSHFERTVMIACCVSLCTFVGNDHVLKLMFGRPIPAAVVLHHAAPAFHFMEGSFRSSFPSGHMAMACSFGLVLLRGCPRLAPWLIALLAMAAVALVVGDWHFVGDVIAGTFVGSAAGFWGWELWTLHIQHWGGSQRAG